MIYNGNVYAVTQYEDGDTKRHNFKNVNLAKQWAHQAYRDPRGPIQITVFRQRYLRAETRPTEEPVSVWSKC